MIGIINFFHDQSYLDSLISETFYCNTPEFYRQYKAEGVSDKIAPFLNTIQFLTPLQVIARKVDYCDKAINRSPICKDVLYSYQREFRFLIGQCTITQVEGLKLNRENGFSEFILKNPKIVFKLE